MQKIIDYAVNMGLKRYLPLLSLGVVSGTAALWATYQGALQKWGITYFTWPWTITPSPSGPCILIELDTLSKAAIVVITAAVPVIMRAFEHHAINPILPTQNTPTTSAKGE